ncbi:MAG: hypothetical protein MJ154_00785 [Candidatus Saccharibacteria bacterium]|nr:hypothetical protein [Candidatus Saccharibacteria bacterium]
MDKVLIKQMLKKSGAVPFYYGNGDESYFWLAAEIDGEIFAQRAYYAEGEGSTEVFYYCQAHDRMNIREIYDNMVVDFVVFYKPVFVGHLESSVFEDIASPEDEGLCELLSVFHKKYSDFLKDVIYWVSVIGNLEPDDGIYEVAVNGPLSQEERIVKTVLDRLMVLSPLVVETEDFTYVWRIVKANGDLWYQKSTYRRYDEYSYATDEYGHFSKDDNDAFNALSDAVLACFCVEGWRITSRIEDIDDVLALVELTYEEITE